MERKEGGIRKRLETPERERESGDEHRRGSLPACRWAPHIRLRGRGLCPVLCLPRPPLSGFGKRPQTQLGTCLLTPAPLEQAPPTGQGGRRPARFQAEVCSHRPLETPTSWRGKTRLGGRRSPDRGRDLGEQKEGQESLLPLERSESLPSPPARPPSARHSETHPRQRKGPVICCGEVAAPAYRSPRSPEARPPLPAPPSPPRETPNAPSHSGQPLRHSLRPRRVQGLRCASCCGN